MGRWYGVVGHNLGGDGMEIVIKIKCYISAKKEKFSLKESENVPKEDKFEKMLNFFLIGMNILGRSYGQFIINEGCSYG